MCCERSGQERWVAPHRVLPGDEQVVTGIHCQSRDILYELFEFEVLFTEFVDGLQSVIVVLRNESSSTDLKGTDVRGKLGDVSEEIRILIFFPCVCVCERFIPVKHTVSSKM